MQFSLIQGTFRFLIASEGENKGKQSAKTPENNINNEENDSWTTELVEGVTEGPGGALNEERDTERSDHPILELSKNIKWIEITQLQENWGGRK